MTEFSGAISIDGDARGRQFFGTRVRRVQVPHYGKTLSRRELMGRFYTGGFSQTQKKLRTRRPIAPVRLLHAAKCGAGAEAG